MDILRPQYALLHTLFFLWLLLGLFFSFPIAQASVLTLNNEGAFLEDTVTEIKVNGGVSLYPRPNQEYKTMDVILENTQASIIYLSAGIARHTRFTLPQSDQYEYRFNAYTARVEINHANSPMLSLPVDREGRTPLVRIGADRYTHIQVDQNGQIVTADDALIAGRYQPIEGGSIIHDVSTGLEWQRCAVGQTWNAAQQSCDGEASTFTWNAVIELTAPGRFRAPNIAELRSLVYCSTGQPQEFGMNDYWTLCDGNYQQPTILTEAFPNTPADWFWSTSTTEHDSGLAWNLNFAWGYVDDYDKNGSYAVRLVRSAQ